MRDPRSGPEITVRRFRPTDLEAVHDLIERTIDRSYATAYGPEARGFFRAYHAPSRIEEDAATGLTLVIEDHGIAATGSLVQGNIRRVFVEPSRQHQGMGRRIMAALEGATEPDRPSIDLDASLVSRPFYERLGFLALEHRVLLLPGGGELPYFYMVKRLR